VKRDKHSNNHASHALLSSLPLLDNRNGIIIYRVTIFENADGKGGKWIERIIATTGSHNALVADINGDGMPDIVGCNFAEADNPLEVWYNDILK